MLILSWNVAGWVKALMCIRLSTIFYVSIVPYHDEKFIFRQFHGSLESWLNKHGIDIIALQEVKARHEVIRDTPAVVGADIDGWDSFWSPCRLKGSAGGFNGVATFARKGLCLSADCTPLESEDLDIEGRAIVTDHGSFILFNVYVPNDSAGGSRLPYKMRFLRRLR